MLQQREEWNHQPRGAVVIDTEDSDLDKEDSVIPPLIYTEYSDDKEYHPCESLSGPHYAEPTPEPRPPSKKTT